MASERKTFYRVEDGKIKSRRAVNPREGEYESREVAENILIMGGEPKQDPEPEVETPQEEANDPEEPGPCEETVTLDTITDPQAAPTIIHVQEDTPSPEPQEADDARSLRDLMSKAKREMIYMHDGRIPINVNMLSRRMGINETKAHKVIMRAIELGWFYTPTSGLPDPNNLPFRRYEKLSLC